MCQYCHSLEISSSLKVIIRALDDSDETPYDDSEDFKIVAKSKIVMAVTPAILKIGVHDDGQRIIQ